MIPELEQALAPQEYNELPVSIKAALSPKEWAWLSDNDKARLVQNETEPDVFDD